MNAPINPAITASRARAIVRSAIPWLLVAQMAIAMYAINGYLLVEGNAEALELNGLPPEIVDGYRSEELLVLLLPTCATGLGWAAATVAIAARRSILLWSMPLLVGLGGLVLIVLAARVSLLLLFLAVVFVVAGGVAVVRLRKEEVQVWIETRPEVGQGHDKKQVAPPISRPSGADGRVSPTDQQSLAPELNDTIEPTKEKERNEVEDSP